MLFGGRFCTSYQLPHFSMIIHALYILKIYFQVVEIDFALNHLIKLKVFCDG